MAANVPINVTQNELGGGSNDGKFPALDFFPTPSPLPPIPADIQAKGVTTVGTGTASSVNSDAGTFNYNGGTQCPAAGQPAVNVAFPMTVRFERPNGCICEGVIWSCITLEPATADCTGFDPDPISTTWNCDTKLNPVSAAIILLGVPNATLTDITPGGPNPAGGGITDTPSTGLTGYNPTQAELDLAVANGTHTVSVVAEFAGTGAQTGCFGTRVINITIANPCADVTFASVDFTN